MELRGEKNNFYKCTLRIARSSSFTFLISLSIVLNTCVLALDSHPIEPQQEDAIELTNLIFYVIFLVEMVIKMSGLGLLTYFNDRGNIFDAVIVLLSTVDVCIFLITSFHEEDKKANSGAIEIIGSVSQVFRIFRLLRVFKLAQSWENFNYFLNTISNTISKISSFSVLLLLFIFMYAIMGMEFFANRIRFDFDNKSVKYFAPENPQTLSKVSSIPDSNFDNFFNAFLSVFIVLANDGWSTIYFNHYRVVGPLSSTFFFVSLVLIGQMILFNLFLAILLKEFDEK